MWLKGGVLSRSFFLQDDYAQIAAAAHRAPSLGYLFQNHDGRFMPLGYAVTWLLTRFRPYDWGAATAVLLTLQGCASLALLRALRVMFGSRWAVLVPFALYAVTPLTMPALGWYSAALSSLPSQAALAMALAAHVRYLRRERTTYLVQTVGWVVVGMLAGPKAAVIPVLAFAVTSAYFFTGTWAEAARAAWQRHTRMWWWQLRALAALIVLYALSWIGAGTRDDLGGMDADQVAGFAGRLLGQTFPLYFVGGPWRWAPNGEDYATPHPPDGQVLLALAVVVAVVWTSVRYRRVAYRAWLILLGYLLVADVAPVVFGRAPRLGAFLGVDARYVADAAPVLAICLALACTALAGEKEPYVRPMPAGVLLPGVAGLAGGAVVIASVWCLDAYRDRLGGTQGRAFLVTARRELARTPDLRTVFPDFVPTRMMDASFGADRLTTRVLAPLLPASRLAELAHPRPTRHPLVLDAYGRLRPGAVFGTTGTPPPDGSGCWKLGALPRMITLAKPLRVADYVVAVGYLASKPARVEVRYGQGGVARAAFTVRPKYGRFTFALHGGGAALATTRLSGPGRVCVTDVAVGYAVPAAR
ncbi:MAG TPA: hypothetical protein VGL93_03430 [Streptosporangiaceae bacterium]